ncbi:MAG: galactose-1-phosphate uridylyltransferase [Nitrospinota bacterium]|nr:MAG: galactose-1-phosphate uridylyltransferase [Nitrospinota bacterium]
MRRNEIRQNKATGQWTIYAPDRGGRPHDHPSCSSSPAPLPDWEERCPFCPGNEQMLPPILFETPGLRGNSWQTRVVPNKFPALTPEGGCQRSIRGIYLAMPGFGHHEVIIDSPLHNRDIAEMAGEEVEALIETYHYRYLSLKQTDAAMLVLIFRNHGKRAGTSLIHPHSQVIATGIVPHHIRWREEEGQRYFDTWGRCVYCDILAFEEQDRQRVIWENASFLAFIPFAAEVPFETWIVPKCHRADFGAIADGEKKDFAQALHAVLQMIYRKLENPDYNYVLHTATRYNDAAPHLHWYLQICPRLTTTAGFEIGSGIRINPTLPEENAAFLQEE